MTAPYAFYFDARFCSGCKACQTACKDRNRLPPGVLWRRVYEVTGGGWEQSGGAWTSTVFAYNLSVACNHCVHPKCAGVCPVDAYRVREDGIVLLDSSKCTGCGYCAWACPYGAPQLDRRAGIMGKCNFCHEEIDAGLPPACVAACPLRVLDFGGALPETAALPGSRALWQVPPAEHPYPLPVYSRTEPHLAIRPHPGMERPEEKQVANVEEIRPQPRSGWEEAPLVMFTLLCQMAAGALWWVPWLLTPLWALVQYDARGLRLAALSVIGVCLGAGMAASFAHLGRKRNAWRMLRHVRKSWLSRELLFAVLFGAGWLAILLATVAAANPAPWMGVTALLGAGLVYSMGQVYRLRAVPAWNTWRTNTGFFISALLSGLLLAAALLAFESQRSGILIPALRWRQIGILALALLGLRAGFGTPGISDPEAKRLWRWLLAVGTASAAAVFLVPALVSPWALLLVLLVVMAEEGLGRWVFYEARVR
ncbi:MAG: DmsC/YnfH family molybdoenzyme membrane anchor subunit [Bacteroidota bacterium]